ncbi:darobactin family peptide antibiotic [Xenorhabdus griffiniae]|uniref:darobactin family peptide antibiotic n=1 Tax=Xenorhabdus griffiniae TaxID=351672 RepID=UPI002358D16C|nr:darobactin family peptide antibiotic [Xenorhabdus griffiniae]MDC9605038.1 darobactin family peptide antibiotic [Xenorhabdus griffiniae]
MINTSNEMNRNQEALSFLATSFKGTDLSISQKSLDDLKENPTIPEISAWNWSKGFQEL